MTGQIRKPLDDCDFVQRFGHADFDPVDGEPMRQSGSTTQGEPIIFVRTDESAVIDEAIAALASGAELFHRGGALVHVIPDPGKLSQIARSPGTPRIVPLPHARLRELCSDAARWRRRADKGVVDAHPPDWAVRGVQARGVWPTLRLLEAVVETPVLRADGSVLDRPGYDRTTGLLYLPRDNFPVVAVKPTRDDARHAAERLLDAVADFPFATGAHRSAWLSAVLTPLARFAFAGPAPLHLIDANVRGAGKSLLADVVSTIALGRPMARMAPSEDDAEERKRITAIALAGDPLILIDNVAGSLGTPSLDAALTATTWRDRLLGSNTTFECPLFCTWYATGNNVVLQGDTSRRCLHLRLESPEEHPEDRSKFRHPNLLAWVRQERAALVAAALTMLRAYVVAGRPSPNVGAWGSFEEWSSLVRHAIVWAGQDDPALTRQELRSSSDRDASALEDLIGGWQEVAAELGGRCTVAQALTALAAPGNGGRYERLRAALGELTPTPPGQFPSARRVGLVLTRFKGRVVSGRALMKATERTMSGIQWCVGAVESASVHDNHDKYDSVSPLRGRGSEVHEQQGETLS